MRKTWKIALAAVAAVLVGFGLVVADAVTRTLEVEVTSHIEICRQGDGNQWEVIDEVGPVEARFEASLLDIATGKQVETAFTLQATSREGKPYSVRLAQPGKIEFNPASGRFVGRLVYDVSYDGKRSRVTAKVTTESEATPLGGRRGARARGILGQDVTTVTLVSSNRMALPGEPGPLMLVAEERYTLTPVS